MRRAGALLIALVMTVASATSGLGARCLMMGRCAHCPEWIAASSPVATIAAPPACSSIAPAAPRRASSSRAIAFAPAAVESHVVPALPSSRPASRGATPDAFAGDGDSPPGGLALRI